MSPRGRKINVVSLLAASLVTLSSGGCGTSSGDAKIAETTALNWLKQDKEFCGKPNELWSRECDNFSTVFISEKEPTSADKKNGINQIFHVGIGYAARLSEKSKDIGPWKDAYICAIVVDKNGDWSVATRNEYFRDKTIREKTCPSVSSY